MRRCLLTLMVAALVVPLISSTAGAATLDAHGWWWRPQTGLLGAAIPPPGVPEKGLAVESLPEEATAVSAVRYALTKDETQPALILKVADQQGEIAIQACAATNAWESTHGGPWDERPTYDCGTAVDGAPAEDGKTWRWELSSLLRNRRINVVLVPAAGAGRVTFEAPDNTSLQTQRDTGSSQEFDPPPVSDFTDPEVAPPAGDSGGGSQGFDPPPPAAGGSAGAGAPPPAMPPADSGGSPAVGGQTAQPPPVAPGAAAEGELLPQVAGATESAAAPAAAPPTVPTSSQSSTTIGAIIAAMAVLLGLALWHQDSSIPRQVAPLARAGIPVAATQVGGLGRFARPRSGPPPPLL